VRVRRPRRRRRRGLDGRPRLDERPQGARISLDLGRLAGGQVDVDGEQDALANAAPVLLGGDAQGGIEFGRRS
jgi:hypothetical protein